MERIKTVFEDWLPEPLTVATWMLKSFMTGPPLRNWSSSATKVWGDWFDTTDSPFLNPTLPFAWPTLETNPTHYYIRFDVGLRCGFFMK